jgi:hypothetical protein
MPGKVPTEIITNSPTIHTEEARNKRPISSKPLYKNFLQKALFSRAIPFLYNSPTLVTFSFTGKDFQ